MKQMSFAESGFERRPKRTRRQQFLAEMDAVIPWQRLVALVEPVQPKMGARSGQQGPAALLGGDDAAHPLHAAVVRTFRSGDGRGLARHSCHARLRAPGCGL